MLFEEEVKNLLKPGYQTVETGYHRLPNGEMCVSSLVPMPGCRGEWIEWWAGTYLEDTKSFRRWAPETITFKWDKNWKPGLYMGASAYLEMFMGDKITKSIRKFVDPAKYIDTLKIKEAGIEAIFCADDFSTDGEPKGRIIHVARHTDTGCEMRIRHWISSGTEEMAQFHLTKQLQRTQGLADFLKICAKESVIPETETRVKCKFCLGSNVVRYGQRKNNQYWLCKDCGHYFVNNEALPRMRYPACTIASAVHDYYDGYSLSQICSDIEKTSHILPSTSSVYGWVKKLTEKALNEESSYHPLVGDSWILYRTSIQFNNVVSWLTYVLDADTQFVLGAKLSNDIDTTDIQVLMASARIKSGKMPKEILTNIEKKNLQGVELAYGADSKHIHIVSITDEELNHNFVQVFPGMIKNRLRLKNDNDMNDGTHIVLNGFVFHHNYIRPRNIPRVMPAEAAKTELPFRDWVSILRTELS